MDGVFGVELGVASLALSSALVHSLWQDAIVALLLWATLTALRRSYARTRYIAGCLALAAMALLPVATALLLYLQDVTTAYTQAPAPLPIGVADFTSGISAALAIRVSSSPWTTTLHSWALPLWLVGVFASSLRLFASAAHMHAIRRRCQAAEEAVAFMVERVAKRVGVRRVVSVFRCDRVSGASTIGWLRPAILFPPATLLGLTSRQLEAVIAHELAHVRRHDYLVNAVQLVIETLFFYHPAIWWASRRIRTERELCCDDIAVATCGDPLEYAAALTQLARVRAMTPRFSLSSAGGPLLQRVQRLLLPAPAMAGSRLPIVVALAMAFVTTTFGHAWIRADSLQVSPRASTTSTVTGVLYDPFGAPVADVPITLDNGIDSGDNEPLAAPVLLETRTNAEGRYRFDEVPAGAFVVLPGISWARPSPVTVPAGRAVEHDVRIAFDTVVTGLMMLPGGRPPTASIVFPSQVRQSETLPVRGPEHINSWNRPYPDALQAARLEGVVVVEGRIGPDGKAADLRVATADHPELAKAALAALEQERWHPARVRGVPIEVPLRATLEYRLTLR